MNSDAGTALFASLIMFWATWLQFNQTKEANDIIQYGEIVTAVIVEMPEDCIASTRGKIYSKVILPNSRQYRMAITEKECGSMVVGEQVKLFYSSLYDDIRRYTAGNADRKPTSLWLSILLSLPGAGFFIYFITELKKDRKEAAIEKIRFGK